MSEKQLTAKRIPETIGNRFAELLTIAYKAHELEYWLSKHVGPNDDWPARLMTDNEADAKKLAAILRELDDALKPFRRDYFPVTKPPAEKIPENHA